MKIKLFLHEQVDFITTTPKIMQYFIVYFKLSLCMAGSWNIIATNFMKIPNKIPTLTTGH